MQDNVALDKSYTFSLRIVKLFLHLKEQKVERTLIVQLLRSGTSIGANIEEAVGAQSKKDFINEVGIAYKEARETHYWLRLLKDVQLPGSKLADSFIQDVEELKKILASIINTSKGRVLSFFFFHF